VEGLMKMAMENRYKKKESRQEGESKYLLKCKEPERLSN